MAVPADAWKIVYTGTLRGGEVWQTGYWLLGNAPTSNASAQAGAQLEFDSEGTSTPSSVWQVLKAMLPSSITLDRVTVYSYPAGGTVAQFQGVSTGAAHLGAAANSVLPNQACLVATLLTGAAGRSHRGRMYLPWGSAGMDTASGQAASTTIDAVCTALAAKFTDGNAASGWGKAVVVSQVLGSGLQILNVRMDSRMDVQRRRANKQVAAYVKSSPVTP